MVESCDIAIIGSGPAGLAAALACACALPQARIAVFDKASSHRPAGAAVAVERNGQGALGAISPHALALLQDASHQYEHFMVMDEKGNVLVKRARRPKGMLNLAWSDVQQALLHSLLPNITVHLHQCFIGYTELCDNARSAGCSNPSRPSVAADHAADLHAHSSFQAARHSTAQITAADASSRTDICSMPGTMASCSASHNSQHPCSTSCGVHVHFANGNTVEAKLLVGADGSRSAVRAACLKDGPPPSTGFVTCRAIVPEPDCWPWPNQMIFFGQRLLIQPLQHRKLAWAGLLQEQAAQHGTPEEVKQMVLHSFQQYAQPIRQLMQSTPADSILFHGVYCRSGQLAQGIRFGYGHVTTVGDACHVSHPMLGQGTSQAFEDALALGHALSQLGPTAAALRAYEQAREHSIMDFAGLTATTVSLLNSRLAQQGQLSGVVDYLAGQDFERLGKAERRMLIRQIVAQRFEPIRAKCIAQQGAGHALRAKL